MRRAFHHCLHHAEVLQPTRQVMQLGGAGSGSGFLPDSKLQSELNLVRRHAVWEGTARRTEFPHFRYPTGPFRRAIELGRRYARIEDHIPSLG